MTDHECCLPSPILKRSWIQNSTWANVLPGNEIFTFNTNGIKLDVFFRYTESFDELEIAAIGGRGLVVDFVDQIARARSALHPSQDGDRLECCLPRALFAHTFLRLHFLMTSIESNSSACWVPLFCGACIAYGFVIPERKGQTGLEISFPILAALVGAGHAVEYHDAVVIKGYSSMVVPTKREGQIVQWHLVTSDNLDQRLTYSEGLARCANYASKDQVDLNCLQATRAILGWCIVAESLLGSGHATYESIEYSGAEDEHRPLRVTGGSFGFQRFISRHLELRLGPKDGKYHIQRSGPYQRVVTATRNTPIALYDTLERGAWLVPACDVILHMCHNRNRLEHFGDPSTSNHFPTTEPLKRSAATFF